MLVSDGARELRKNHRLSSFKTIRLVPWKIPPRFIIKINVHVTIQSNIGNLVVNGITKDYDSAWLGGFSIPIGQEIMLKAEVHAIMLTLELGRMC